MSATVPHDPHGRGGEVDLSADDVSPDGDVPRQPYLHDLTCLVRAPACVLSNPDGQIEGSGVHGLFVSDIRALSVVRLLVDGVAPAPLRHWTTTASAARFVASLRAHDDVHVGPTVLLIRERAVDPAGMRETYEVVSHARTVVRVRMTVQVGSDLADISDVKSGRQVPPCSPAVDSTGLTFDNGEASVHVTLAMVRHDQDQSEEHFDVIVRTTSDGFRVEGELKPGQSVRLALTCVVRTSSARFGPAPAGPPPWSSPTVEPAGSPLGRLIERSLTDLDALRMSDSADRNAQFLAAGAPWYLTLFGRDSLWAARMLLPLGTELARGTLYALARRQGRVHRSDAAEQPGKIIHEVRRAPARYAPPPGEPLPVGGQGFVLPAEYYGSVDSTALWVLLLHDAWRWGLAEDDVRALLEPLERALTWMTTDAVDARGLLTYQDTSGRGLVNQGWKDSYDAIQFRDGTRAAGPIALSEVQGYAHEAAVAGATLLDVFGRPGADKYRTFARRLADTFRAHFWVTGDQGRYPAIALDGQGRPVDALTSNIGHLLGTGLLTTAEEAIVGRWLCHPDLHSGYGVRTLAASTVNFNPLSYHRGSVWTHDTAIAIAGLARSGACPEALDMLISGMLASAAHFDYRMPELVSGYGESHGPPVPYPASCQPQAWAAAASITVLQALLGLDVDVPNGRFVASPPTLAAADGITAVRGLLINGQRRDVELAGVDRRERDRPRSG